MVEVPMTLDIDNLIRRMNLEERLYRHRCVEAWSMTIPWSGFPLKDLVDLARPLENTPYADPPGLHPTITYLGHRETAAQILGFFPLRVECGENNHCFGQKAAAPLI